MSLQHVYRLAHTAECRLNISASRPDRNLRFVVGHLMHYEALRLRIVEIEHDISKSERAKAVQFRGTGHVKHKPSTGQLGKRSPPPVGMRTFDGEDEDEPDVEEDDGAEDDELGLQRFGPGSSRPPPFVNDPVDDEDDLDIDEPTSPEEPESDIIEQALKSPSDQDLVGTLNRVRKCPCHEHTNVPSIKHLYMLPQREGDDPNITRAVAQVAA